MGVGLAHEPGEFVVLFGVDEPGSVRDVDGHIFLNYIVLDGDTEEIEEGFKVGVGGEDASFGSLVWEGRGIVVGVPRAFRLG